MNNEQLKTQEEIKKQLREDFLNKLEQKVWALEKKLLPLWFSLGEYIIGIIFMWFIYTNVGRDYAFIVLGLGVIIFGINNKIFK